MLLLYCFEMQVYKDLIISTIVDDGWMESLKSDVYKDLIISTIVDSLRRLSNALESIRT